MVQGKRARVAADWHQTYANVPQRWTNSYGRRHEQTANGLEKIGEKPLGVGIHAPLPPPLYVRGLTTNAYQLWLPRKYPISTKTFHIKMCLKNTGLKTLAAQNESHNLKAILYNAERWIGTKRNTSPAANSKVMLTLGNTHFETTTLRIRLSFKSSMSPKVKCS